jgi:hypothetical protein
MAEGRLARFSNDFTSPSLTEASINPFLSSFVKPIDYIARMGVSIMFFFFLKTSTIVSTCSQGPCRLLFTSEENKNGLDVTN